MGRLCGGSTCSRNLTRLRNLTVSRNLLTELPDSLADLTSLVHLDASINIVGVISAKVIQGLGNLTFLNLSNNDVSRIDISAFNETPSLHYLDLSRNRLQTLNMSTFAALDNLTHLDLADNQIKDINGLLRTQMNLEYLNVFSNQLEWFDYAFVPNTLRTLDIHNNQIDSVENYFSLKDGYELEYLDASRNRIQSLGVLSLLPSLETIIMHNNKISDIGHNTFLNKENLIHVNLRSNNLSVINLASLSVAKGLKKRQAKLPDGRNPFHCSCQMQWIVNQANGDRLPHLADLEEAECLVNYHGNTTAVARLTSVQPEQFLCQYDSHCFSLCMCCDFFGCDCRMQCPQGCSCFHDSTWASNIIQCSARGHAEVPALIPMDATSVFLDGNGLRNLSGQIFLGRSRMKSLYLNNSYVTEVSNNTFLGLMDLQLLDLGGNELQQLEGEEFTDLVNLRELYLQSNKLQHIAEEVFRPLKSLSVLRIDNHLLTTFPIWELSTNPFLVGIFIANNMWTIHLLANRSSSRALFPLLAFLFLLAIISKEQGIVLPLFWATEEKRIFLRQALEARLTGLYYDTGNYQAALTDGAKLLKKLKKLNDKNLLVEVQLLESKTYCALSNLPRVRAALTSARTTANSIYVPPRIQAQLDLQSGILHASEEKDFKTTFSYFFEAFEQYDSVEDPMVVKALKYMLLSKVILNLPDEVTNLVSGKLALRHAGPDMESMKTVALSAKARSLADI